MIESTWNRLAVGMIAASIVNSTTEGIVQASGEAQVYDPPSELGRYVLTPPATSSPVINGPERFGVRPGSPFLYTIPASGERPMTFGVDGLPHGLKVDAASGWITGRIENRASQTFDVTLTAVNARGKDEKAFRIVQGDTICLTPPLGWNSWNCWTHKVSQEKVLATARAMVHKGLINYGWSYINIDDTWQGLRGGEHNAIMPNDKFPDMKAMCDEIHAMGLKVGIYSTPWLTSYAGHVGGSSNNEDGSWYKGLPRGKTHGTYKFDTQDATQWAEWGFDYLKHDWRSNDEVSTKRMADALNASGRDVVLSLSNYAPLKHAEVFHRLANAYRTTGDIRDVWTFNRNNPGSLVGVADIWDYHEKWADYCSPGHYPDPDMLVVGKVGWGGTPHPTKLTPDEQYTHISLWCLWSAPLLIGCPIEEMDDFTVSLLTNPEVLAVNQDPLCAMGRTTMQGESGACVVVKPMADGSKAVGLFNRGDESAVVSAAWDDLGIEGPQRVRDLWRRRDVGVFEERFEAKVRPHGVVLIGVRSLQACVAGE